MDNIVNPTHKAYLYTKPIISIYVVRIIFFDDHKSLVIWGRSESVVDATSMICEAILRPFEPIDRLTLTSHTPPSLIRRCYQLPQMNDADTNNMHVGIPLQVCFHSPTGTYIYAFHIHERIKEHNLGLNGGSKEEEDAVIFMINSQRELREYVLDLVLDISIDCRPKSIMTTKLFPMSLV